MMLILEVDLNYPKELHPKHTDYPLAVESLEVPREWVSPYTEELIQKKGGKHLSVKKLIPNLYDKKKYVLHYRNLQYYLSQGMVLEKIHRVISFDQKACIRKFFSAKICVNLRIVIFHKFPYPPKAYVTQ